MKKISFAVALLAATSLAGCAFGTRYVDLRYPPERQVDFSEIDTDPVDRVGPGADVVALAVRDKRSETDRVGNIRNTFGMDTASVLTDDNISIWVHDALAVELERLGYRVEHPDDATGNEAVSLSADITRVYCDVYAIYDGEVTIVAVLTNPDGDPVTRSFPAKVVSGISFAGTGTAIQESISQALQTAIRQMLLDFGFVGRAPNSSG